MRELSTEWVELNVPGSATTMPAYTARPASRATLPAVIVLEEIFGVNSHIRDVTERVARLGYVAIAPDYHYRHARGQELPYDGPSVQKGMALIPVLKSGELKADLDATVAYLKTRADVDATRLGTIGFCIGGHAAYFAAATEPGVKASVSFYGGGIATFGLGDEKPTVTRTPNIKGSILCLFGGQDKAIPLAQVDEIRGALAAGHVRHEVVVYDDATHGFFCDQRGSYHPERAREAWAKVTQYFATELAAS